jgi:ubiquitin C-terminal hydrolase
MNPLFEGIAANDAKDLVNFIIMTLHLELNKANPNNTNTNYNNIILDQRNKQLMLNNYITEFKKNNQSIISDLFYAMNCNITQCNVCYQQIYNFQTYFFIIFPLEEIRKYRNNYNNMYNIFYNAFNFFNFNNFVNSNVVSIYDCFDYDCKQNLMDGENSMYCNFCKTNRSCLMSTHLITGPEVLILLLNRGHGIEFNVKINFVEHLDLSRYIEYANTGVKYDLFGVITHIGESSMSGHFIAYCKDPILHKWHKFNDAIVSDVNDFQKEVIDFAMPYLLFYQKSQ